MDTDSPTPDEVIETVEHHLAMKLEPWQKLLLHRTFGPEADGLASAYTLNRDEALYYRRALATATTTVVRAHQRREHVKDVRRGMALVTATLLALAAGTVIGYFVTWAVMG